MESRNYFRIANVYLYHYNTVLTLANLNRLNHCMRSNGWKNCKETLSFYDSSSSYTAINLESLSNLFPNIPNKNFTQISHNNIPFNSYLI